MQMKVVETVSVNFDVTRQLLTTAFVIILEEKGARSGAVG